MPYPIDVDNTPLADALTKIAQLCDPGESDPEQMVALLNTIEIACIDGRNAWFANVVAAQRASKAPS